MGGAKNLKLRKRKRAKARAQGGNIFVWAKCRHNSLVVHFKNVAGFRGKDPSRRGRIRKASPPPEAETLFTRKSSYCFQRVLTIAILSVRPSVRLSHWWISQKRCKLESPNLHRRLPGRRKVLGTVKLFHKFEGGHPERGR